MAPPTKGNGDEKTDETEREQTSRRSSATPDCLNTPTPSRRGFLEQGFAASIAVGASVTGIAGTAAAQTAHDESESSTAAVTFRNQFTDGSRVVVESVSLPDGGYVAIHDTSFFKNDPSLTVIAASELLEAGTSENVPVNLFSGIHGVYFESGEIYDDQWLVAVPHRETNGNELYESAVTEEDCPYTESGGPIADIAFATIQETEETTP